MTTSTLSSELQIAFEHEETVSISELVASASDIVAPVWPLKTFIAVNPLQGLERHSFEQAVLAAEQQKAMNGGACTGCETVNREMIKWCSAFFDEGQATIEMPGRENGFYQAFVALAPFDGRLAASRNVLASLPESAEQAISESFDALGIPVEMHEEFIRQSLGFLPGWSGYVKWKEHWQKKEHFAKRPATLVDYIAVRLILTRILWPDAGVSEPVRPAIPPWLAQLPVNEANYRRSLLPGLVSQAKTLAPAPEQRPEAQLVFCIDVRSEPFRKAIESQGAYETFGFAGFFGLPVEVKPYGDDQPHDSCPVLLKPRHLVCDEPADSAHHSCRGHDAGRELVRKSGSLYQWLKYHFATPFALVEMLGPWLGLRMVAKVLFPLLFADVAKKTSAAVTPSILTQPSLKEIPLTQQVDYAEGALRMTGLAEKLAPIVVFCAHGSRTTNNAYSSALDCGACGGNHGGANARILAAILNAKAVRTGLAARNLVIPDDVVFVAAEHNTTTDDVEIFEPHELGAAQQVRLRRLRTDLANARAVNAEGRSRRFGSFVRPRQAVEEMERRSADWSEVRPEWGLARNAAFIVAPRTLTSSLSLDGRCFLHSYDWKTDPNGTFLTTILTAPMVVGQWINSQYLFSTLDNVSYGSGSKVTHNVTGKLGVMQGNASDLMHGLPLQSVFSADGEPYHEPLRLTTVVYAPRERVDAIVRAQDVLQTLFGNGWVTLTCIDPEDRAAYELQRDLSWKTAC